MGVDAAPSAAPASAPAAAPAADAPAAPAAGGAAAPAAAATPAAATQVKDGFDSGPAASAPVSAGGAVPAVGATLASGASAAATQAAIERNIGAAPVSVANLFTAASDRLADSQKEAAAKSDAQKAAELIERVQHEATGPGREATLAALTALGANASGRAGPDLGWINAELAKGREVIASGNASKAGATEADRLLAVMGITDGKYQIADPANLAAKTMSASELTQFIMGGARGGFAISTDLPALDAKSGAGDKADPAEQKAETPPAGTGTPAAGGAKAGDVKAGDVKAGDVKAGDAKAGDVKKAGDPKTGPGSVFDHVFSSQPHPATDNKRQAAEEEQNGGAAQDAGQAGPAAPQGFFARAPGLPWVSQENPVGKDVNYVNGRENCGPAVLAMLARLRRLYPNLTDAQLIMLLGKMAGTTDQGTTGNGMIAALHDMGFQTEASKGADLAWIDQQLAQGHDVICNGDYYSVPGREKPGVQAGHYIAVTANNNGVYTVDDPEDQNVHTMTAAQLKKFIASHPQGGFSLAAW